MMACGARHQREAGASRRVAARHRQGADARDRGLARHHRRRHRAEVRRVGEDRERHRRASRRGESRDHPGPLGRCGRRICPARARARGARCSRATCGDSKISSASATRSAASRNRSRSRRAARFASSSSPGRCHDEQAAALGARGGPQDRERDDLSRPDQGDRHPRAARERATPAEIDVRIAFFGDVVGKPGASRCRAGVRARLRASDDDRFRGRQRRERGRRNRHGSRQRRGSCSTPGSTC